jgi:DNA-binding IclR family transcriptional regulator
LRIGKRVAILNRALERDDDDTRILRPYVEEVNATSGETVYLTRLAGGRVAIQLVAEGRQSLRVTGLSVGFFGAEDHRASGKAVMAHLPEAMVRSILELNHQDEAAEAIQNRLDVLRPVLEAARRHGFAFDDEEYEEGICCVAAPYFDAAGRVVGSLAVSAPAVRRDALRGAIRDEVVATSRRMSAALGAPRPGATP